MNSRATPITVLVVDDNADNIDILRQILRSEYKVKAAKNGELALLIATTKPKPDLILLDVMMPGMDGYEVCRQLKANPITAAIPVIFVTAKSEEQDEQKGLSLGAVDYITKPVSVPIVRARVRTHLALYHRRQQLNALVAKRTQELEHTRLEIIRRLGRAAEYKDNETGMHVVRMSYYAKLLAEQIGASDEWVELLYNAAPMHDIGKIGIADSILMKPAKLDHHERQEMQKHVEYGADIIGLNSSALLTMAREVCLYHHEKYDGSGYPHGIAGSAIPLSARIITVADVFDALTSERPYKQAWTYQQAIDYLQQHAGSIFDPDLVTAFIACEQQVKHVMQQYNDAHEQQLFGNKVP
ncbi:two-component system response regulator [Thalassotalea ponticola]|uniref:response regulator n=1 Tax=Thalassotalea ponticola TaxID=1523392 RepID=UPI0025B5A959|nr:two-component system response regulator [Thalassotalea ponticola]MDN3651788.1 two-component system response regulator [Thalassotalea ponticola]